jgi:hypothetical protein
MASFPTARAPSVDEVYALAEGFGIRLEPDAAEAYQRLIAEQIGAYSRLDALVEPALPVEYPRLPGHRPSPEENPYNAWYWKSEVKGKARGPLAGKTAARRLCPRCRRDRGHAHSGCRRHDSRQGGLRLLVPRGLQHHRVNGLDRQSA